MLIAMKSMAEFGALIRRARENAGLTGVELAQRVGRPHSFVARIEGGKYSNPPDPHDFNALSRELRISKEEMLRALGYLDAPNGDAEGGTVPAGEETFYAALGEYLPLLGEAQRRHLIETARLMAGAAVTRAPTPGASSPSAGEESRIAPDRPSEG